MLVFIIMVSLFAATSYADDDIPLDKAEVAGQSAETQEKVIEDFITVTRPEDNETTDNRLFVVCGVTKYEGIIVELKKFNFRDNKYESITVDGESSWLIGDGGFFAKEIELDEGVNRIKFIAYKDAEPEVKQVSVFKVMVKKNIKKQIKDGMDNKLINII
ncbi:hypothetical protein DFR58_13929 [Anaerobacterium chartisolvens]|uniref:Uncharacterized protein n=2 Tax=Anaerobacterium chartisolvens TaxID=1297424 RepID=A0A369AIA9_9FIRM|nr:hypothetical protein DFR58_13929 [Anaerobacterium chartisolvens]